MFYNIYTVREREKKKCIILIFLNEDDSISSVLYTDLDKAIEMARLHMISNSFGTEGISITDSDTDELFYIDGDIISLPILLKQENIKEL